jgi:hypothetical protein
MGGNNRKSKKKCAMFQTTDWGLNQYCMENLLQQLVVSVQNSGESVTDGRL